MITRRRQPNPEPVDTTGLPEDTAFGAIGAGSTHSLAVTVEGTAYACGNSVRGQLGTGQYVV